jgi:NAD+ synthase
VTARALGPENVHALLLPYKQSSPASQGDAELVVELLGVQSTLLDITPQVDAYFERLPEAERMRRANKMARERMTIVYDFSAALGALVVGTSNKTESLLGYTTLWGDMACAINPLGDLYKTQVRALAGRLGVPEQIIHKAPSADLWAGQTDEGELGFTYEQVDQVLYLMVDERRSVPDIVSRGLAQPFVERVREMVQNSQYKRRMPIVAKVSHRSIDRDFRYARDWGR